MAWEASPKATQALRRPSHPFQACGSLKCARLLQSVTTPGDTEQRPSKGGPIVEEHRPEFLS